MKNRFLICTVILFIGMVLLCHPVYSVEKAFPSKTIEFIVATGPGGGGDRLMRMIKSIMIKHGLVKVPITVINKPGGAGIVGFNYLQKKKGDGHALFVTTNGIFLSELYGRVPKSQHYSNMSTPLATLVTDWCSIGVASGSKYQSALQLMNDLKKDPGSVSFGFSIHGSNHHLSLVYIAQKLGIDPTRMKFIAYSGSGALTPAVLGRHVDAFSQPPSGMPEQLRAGKVRYLAMAANTRMTGDLAGIPTWRELGYDIVFSHWKGIAGPPDMPTEAIAWWDKTLAAFVKTPEWQKIKKLQGWDDFYKNSSETAAFWKEDFDKVKSVVTAVGLLKKNSEDQ